MIQYNTKNESMYEKLTFLCIIHIHHVIPLALIQIILVCESISEYALHAGSLSHNWIMNETCQVHYPANRDF